jgi:CrcB protein
MLAVLVALAAGAGAVLRYVVDVSVARRVPSGLPWGTLVVNVSGAFVFGLVVGLATHHGLHGKVATVLGAGFAGGYTTLSTWSLETLFLVRDRSGLLAMANAGLTSVLGLAAAAAGLALALA